MNRKSSTKVLSYITQVFSWAKRKSLTQQLAKYFTKFLLNELEPLIVSRSFSSYFWTIDEVIIKTYIPLLARVLGVDNVLFQFIAFKDTCAEQGR